MVKLGLGRVGLEETAGAGQQKVERRNAFSHVNASATGGQKEQGDERRAWQKFSHGLLSQEYSGRMVLQSNSENPAAAGSCKKFGWNEK